MGEGIGDCRLNLQPAQIVYLEHEGCRVYAEVVQVVELRQICWVRPWVMIADGSAQQPKPEIIWTDLREGSDLLMPLQLFQPASDVDILPVLDYLYKKNINRNQGKSEANIHQELTKFIRGLSAAFPESFINCRNLP